MAKTTVKAYKKGTMNFRRMGREFPTDSMWRDFYAQRNRGISFGSVGELRIDGMPIGVPDERNYTEAEIWGND